MEIISSLDIFSDSIPIGGLHITSDIVRGLGTKSEDAEKIKILHGSTIAKETDEYINLDMKYVCRVHLYCFVYVRSDYFNIIHCNDY